MKALKTSRANAVLSDPRASEQLRRFLSTRHSQSTLPGSATVIEVVSEGKLVRFRPLVVPKAA